MIETFAILFTKYSVATLKVLAFVVAVLTGAHGFSVATPTPAHEDAHAAPAATPAAEEHGETHGETHGDAHSTPAHGDVHVTPTPAHGDADAPADGHEDAHAADPHAPAAHGDAHADAEHGAGHGDAHADEHHAAPKLGAKVWGVPNGIWHAINFLLLFGGIFFLARKGLIAAARRKRDETAKGIEEATKLREEMRKKFEDYDARMRNIDQQMSTLVSDAKADAESERQKLVADATALAGRMREDAKQIADQEIARARRELQEEQIARAAELAEQILKANVTKDDQARLADEFMKRVDTKEGRA